jgi:malate dehydrogenase (oxaloacetate-decarboxylating)
MNFAKEEIARSTNLSKMTGTIKDAMKGADIFIGVSAGNVIKSDMIEGMANDPIVFAMANPIPEIMPDAAKEGGAKIVGTGRSDFPNQINNVLGFPGIFRGALNVRAREINETMKIGAADALAGIIPDDELSEEHIIPSPFDERVVPAIASAVADAAIESGVARIKGGE